MFQANCDKYIFTYSKNSTSKKEWLVLWGTSNPGSICFLRQWIFTAHELHISQFISTLKSAYNPKINNHAIFMVIHKHV